jgi:gliding motility-associated-like protein
LFNCTDTITPITDTCQLYVPNVFTPNNDELNDGVNPITNCIYEDYQFLVFNRWGQLVFKTPNQADKWDGEINGSDCPDGVYVYRINYKFPSQKTKSTTGTITLLR